MRVSSPFSGVSAATVTRSAPPFGTRAQARRSSARVARIASRSTPEGTTTIRSAATPSRRSWARTALEMATTRAAVRQARGLPSGEALRRVAIQGAVAFDAQRARVTAWPSCACRMAGPHCASRRRAQYARGSRPIDQVTSRTGTPSALARWANSEPRRVRRSWSSPSRWSSRARSQVCRCPPRHSRPEATWRIRFTERRRRGRRGDRRGRMACATPVAPAAPGRRVCRLAPCRRC